MAKGIRRVVDLILNKDSAKRTEKGIKEALDKGTDPKKPVKNVGRLTAALKSAKGAAVALGGALVAAVAARKLFTFLKRSVQTATEAGEIWTRLAGALHTVGVEFSEVEGHIKGMAAQMQATTRVGDEDFAAILTELISTSGDYAQSLQSVELVADLAAAKQIELKTAAQLVGRVMIGETGTLSRYGIVVSEGVDAMELMRTKFAGMAKNELRTFGGLLAQMNNAWGDFKQAVGDVIVQSGAAQSIITSLTAGIQRLTAWVETNSVAVREWGDRLARVLDLMLKVAEFSLRLFRSSAARAAQAFMDTIAGQEARQQLISTRMEIERLERSLSRPGSAGYNARVKQIEFLRSEYERLAAQIAATETAQNRLDQATGGATVPGAPTTGTGPASPLGTGFGHPDLSGGAAGQAMANFHPSRRVDAGFVQHSVTQEEIDALTQAYREGMQDIEWAAQRAAWGISNAFGDAFEILLKDFDNLGDAAVALGTGIGKALLQGLADYAMGKVAENIAMGFEMLAIAANPFTLGVTAPSASAHFLAAAKWAVVAGLAGGAASAVGGAGGGGSASAEGGSDVTPQGPDITFIVDVFDPDNPVHQDSVGAAYQYAVERHGSNARIRSRRKG